MDNLNNRSSEIKQLKSLNNKQLPKGGFTFKRFFVGHENCPMKITTDSVLLGAWTPLASVKHRVLDIGAGCGVIALMLAQRLEQRQISIDGIDISEQAIKQFSDNIQAAPFAQVYASLANIQQYRLNEPASYDLIVCNPPYFPMAVDCRDTLRQHARYTTELNHQQLLIQVNRLLLNDGLFCLVLPYRLHSAFIEQAKLAHLHVQQVLHVAYSALKEASLSLLCFKKGFKTDSKSDSKASDSIPPRIDALVMRHADNSYTDELAQLMQEFYLRF